MNPIIPPGASNAASPDLAPEERKAFDRARAIPDDAPRKPVRWEDLDDITRSRLEWEWFGYRWEEPSPPQRPLLARLEIFAHKAMDVVFKGLKRLV